MSATGEGAAMVERLFCVIGGEGRTKTHMSLVEPDGEGRWWPVCRHPSPRGERSGPVGSFDEVRAVVSCYWCRTFERRMLLLVQGPPPRRSSLDSRWRVRARPGGG